jgi:hypothetical protein
MVLSKRAILVTHAPHRQGAVSNVVLIAALSGTACNAYEPGLIGHGRGAANGAGGALDAAANGGNNQSAAGSAKVVGETGGAPSGQGGGRNSSESTGGGSSTNGGGRSGADGGMVGHAGSVNGGAGTPGSTTGGAADEITGGTRSDGGTASSGSVGRAGAGAGGADDTSSPPDVSNGGVGGASSDGMAGEGGASEVCSGCARLSVPLSADSDHARFVLSIPPDSNLTGATVRFRIAKAKGTGSKLRAFVQEGRPDFHLQFSSALSLASLSTSMSTFTFNIENSITSADLTSIDRVGIEILGEGSSSFTNPTVIYVGRISVSGQSVTDQAWTFDTAASVFTTPTANGPAGTMWLNNYQADTNVSGATIGWLGPDGGG